MPEAREADAGLAVFPRTFMAEGALSAWYVFSSSGGDYHGGWAFTPQGLETGFSRVLYTFMVGLLLSRLQWKLKVPRPFITCGLLLALALAMPRLGTETLLRVQA